MNKSAFEWFKYWEKELEFNAPASAFRKDYLLSGLRSYSKAFRVMREIAYMELASSLDPRNNEKSQEMVDAEFNDRMERPSWDEFSSGANKG